MKEEVEVLIVGAGPVGLLLATELVRDGVEVLQVDRMARRSYFCKALGVTPRTLEILDGLDIAQDAIDAGVWLRGQATFNDGQPGPIFDVPEGLPFGSLSLAQFETERLLEACLGRHGGRVAYGWTLTGFTQSAELVRATLEGPGGETRNVDCRWLVGCDGAHSKVRSVLGLDFPGGQYPQTFILSDLDVDWDLPRGHSYRFNHSASATREATGLVAIPVAGSSRRYRLSTMLPAGAAADPAGEARTPPSLEEIAALMTPLLPPGTRLSNQRWSSTYRISHRIVSSYGRGRVFLAGDAAHIHPPVGGQGMNTGLQDVHNLAWKLVLAQRGLAAPGLLESYSEERRAVGLDVVDNTSRALNAALAQRAPQPGMRETQLLISYRGSPIVRDDRVEAADGPVAAGDRIPDAGQLRRAHVRQALRLHERLGRGRHVLFGYAEDEAQIEVLAKGLRWLRGLLGDAAGGFAVLPQGLMLPEREDIPVLEDAGGAFAAALGARPGMIWLARPDGHVGWSGETGTIEHLPDALGLVLAGTSAPAG